MRFFIDISAHFSRYHGLNGNGEINKKELETLALEKDSCIVFFNIFYIGWRQSLTKLHDNRLLVYHIDLIYFYKFDIVIENQNTILA